MAKLTLGTAQITSRNGVVTIRYMNVGSFLVGERTYGDCREGWNAALRFCRENGLRVLS